MKKKQNHIIPGNLVKYKYESSHQRAGIGIILCIGDAMAKILWSAHPSAEWVPKRSLLPIGTSLNENRRFS